MGGELIIVVEDNEKNLKLVRDVLLQSGFQIAEARTAEAALELVAETAPDLILMDIGLPGMSGLEAVRKLKSDPSTASIPVCALTAFAMEEDQERCLRAGFDGYLVKPITVSQLPEQVRALLGGGEEASSEPSSPGPTLAPSTEGTRAKILVVDDTPQNVKLLETVLTGQGYAVISAVTGEQALTEVSEERPDLILLDVVMPGMDGYEVCRRLRADEQTALLPVVMVTARAEEERIKAIEAGADDFVTKPFDQAELMARMRSLLRVKRYQDKIQEQAAELQRWNSVLEERVNEQVAELSRTARMKRFLAPQLADLIVSSGDESFLESHRREITVVFCDLRGFTSFAESGEPEDVMGVLREYHSVLGQAIFEYEGTLERFTGDGLMVFFNDPVPCDDPALRAVRMAVAMQEGVGELVEDWKKRDYQLDLGIGIAQGYATLGRIGFEGRFDYAAIGTVTNLAARLCDRAAGGQILISQRVYAETEDVIAAEPVTELELKGFSKPVGVYTVIGLKEGAYAGAGDD
jgi:CheY-like chemotaxis protein